MKEQIKLAQKKEKKRSKLQTLDDRFMRKARMACDFGCILIQITHVNNKNVSQKERAT